MSIISSIVGPIVSPVVSGLVGGDGGVNTNMVLVMATTGLAETVTIPCQNVGTFNATINWGDGGADSVITAFNDADLAHVYAAIGDYTITISGTFPNIYFNNAGDKLKLKEVTNLGSTGLTRLNGAFYGCDNLTSFTGYANTSAVTTTKEMFRSCTSLVTADVSGFDTAVCTDMAVMFFDCTALAVIDVSGFITTVCTDMSFMFYNCTALAAIDVSGFNTAAATRLDSMFFANTSLTAIDVSGFNTAVATRLDAMFQDCSSVAVIDVSGFNTAAVTNMRAMFQGIIADVAIDGWAIEAVANFTDFLLNATLSTARYDATLVAWDAQNPVDSLSVHFGGSKYTLLSAAATARANLVAVDLWSIIDAGGI